MKAGWGLPEEGKDDGGTETHVQKSVTQAILSRLIQRLRDVGLAKAPRTPGLQDFLRIRATERSTWDNLLGKIGAIINYGLLRIKIFIVFGLISLAWRPKYIFQNPKVGRASVPANEAARDLFFCFMPISENLK
jgi:hypothetical protein